MPGDSIPPNRINDTLGMPDSLYQQLAANHSKTAPAADGTAFFMEIAVFVSFIALPFVIVRLRNRYRQKQAFKAAEEKLEANFTQYDESLSINNAYYRSLPADLRRRFLERVVRLLLPNI